MPKYKRIMILGGAGAGKTFISDLLSQGLNIPVYHLDYSYWQPNWVRPDEEKWVKEVAELSKTDEWVMDGTYCSSLDSRLQRADLVIYLDINRWTRCFSIFKRYLNDNEHQNLPLGCKPRLDKQFLHWAFVYKKNYGTKVLKKVKEYDTYKFVKFKSRKKAQKFVEDIINRNGEM